MPNTYHFADDATAKIQKFGPLCAGKDPQADFMPPHLVRQGLERFPDDPFEAMGWTFTEFNRIALDAIAGIVGVIKPQAAMYEECGPAGMRALASTIAMARKLGLTVVVDAKRGDGGPTAQCYANAWLGASRIFKKGAGPNDPPILSSAPGPFRVDCLTVLGGYIGPAFVDALLRVTAEYGTGAFFVDRTSFKPNSPIERMVVTDGNKPVWQKQAELVKEWGNGTKGACGLSRIGVVMGATCPEEAVAMRLILPEAIFLVPGYGAQGAGPDDAVVGMRKDGTGVVINSSRGIDASYYTEPGKKPGPFATTPEKFADAIRSSAIAAQKQLILAAQKAGKWPYGMPKVLQEAA